MSKLFCSNASFDYGLDCRKSSQVNGELPSACRKQNLPKLSPATLRRNNSSFRWCGNDVQWTYFPLAEIRKTLPPVVSYHEALRDSYVSRLGNINIKVWKMGKSHRGKNNKRSLWDSHVFYCYNLHNKILLTL